MPEEVLQISVTCGDDGEVNVRIQSNGRNISARKMGYVYGRAIGAMTRRVTQLAEELEKVGAGEGMKFLDGTNEGKNAPPVLIAGKSVIRERS